MADTKPPHVLIFPFPAQGHVNSMLKLTELLLQASLNITFLISAKDHGRLSRFTTVHSHLNRYSGFRFHVIHGLYEGPMDTDEKLNLMVADSLPKVATPLLRDLLLDDSQVTCLIADGIMGFSLDAAQGTGVPVIFFRTISACAFWAYFCIPNLINSGDLPFQGSNLDKRIVTLKGMEGFLRRRDLPSFCRSDLSNQTFQQVTGITRRTPEAHALILNTFDDLEGPIVSQIQKHCSNVYTIGPLHAHLKARSSSKSTSSNSLFEEDKTCITWLDRKAPKSVLYVSFGSLATVTREQLMEFWHGLVNSGKPFLWVIREDLVLKHDDENKVVRELEEGTKERGYMVGWVPQEDVLAHPAVGAFLTHNGWNSTLESIVEGVPMVSWPFYADQQINSRFVEAVWKLGLDMKDTCDRTTVEKTIKEVMEDRKTEFIESADRMARLAKESVNEGGSSYGNLNRLVEDIKTDPYVSRCCSKSFTRMQALLLFLCFSTVAAWLVTGHWILNNMLGISLCIAFVSHVRLPNIKVCAMLLICLFVYDIFWVFYSEMFFGANVMVAVATQQASNPVHTVANSLSLPGLQLITKKLELPVKIVFPRNLLGGIVPGNAASDFMMLGLGDMAIPSMLLALVLCFDHRKDKEVVSPLDIYIHKGHKYIFYATCGYAIGLVAALAAGILTHSPQPALLYLVPSTLGPIVMISWSRKELKELWEGSTPNPAEKTHSTEV